MNRACCLKITQQTQISLGGSQHVFSSEMEEGVQSVYCLRLLNAELDVDPIVFVIEMAVKDSLLW